MPAYFVSGKRKDKNGKKVHFSNVISFTPLPIGSDPDLEKFANLIRKKHSMLSGTAIEIHCLNRIKD